MIGGALGMSMVVYALSLRSADDTLDANRFRLAPGATRPPLARLRRRLARPTGEGLGFGRKPAPLERERDREPFIYVPILHVGELRWRARIGAVGGLLLAVAAAALAVAVGIYRLGHVLNQMIQGFMGT
jgi:hypothetical protein